MFTSFTLDSALALPLHRQLYNEVRSAILTGRLVASTRLPSSRELAETLSISRTTVTEAYEQLIAEGYLDARRGSGTYVCSVLPENAMSVPRHRAGTKTITQGAVVFGLSHYGRNLDKTRSETVGSLDASIRFDELGPDLSCFPIEIWSRLLSKHSREVKNELFQYSVDPNGNMHLRLAIAEHLQRARAVSCDARQIVLLSGSQQALDICARILINEGDTVAVESPGYQAAWRVFDGQGARLLKLPVDSEGADVSRIFQMNTPPPKIVYLTPSHQFPTGAALSLVRRVELLKWASAHGTLILEDDYDSEYRYEGRPLPSLQGLLPDAPVIYIGTFSKTMFPGLRIGYAVLPPTLVHAFSSAKVLNDGQNSSLEQYALADFITDGHLSRHVRRMRKIYGQRRNTLTDALRKHFGERARVLGDPAGMHLCAEIQLGLPADEAYRRAIDKGVRVGQVNPIDSDQEEVNSVPLVFGFARHSESTIQRGIRRLTMAWK